jgi:hypothetical protein
MLEKHGPPAMSARPLRFAGSAAGAAPCRVVTP